ncbi:MAG TPA: helix-turn-helix domain-containing protein [Cellvibrionaceae bacterium]|nr:helix-turn-helix domain-containing protein [Cellvibrionaceae bacterium]
MDFHIKNLRRKINIQPDVQYIKSVYGAGYKLI